MADFWGLWRGGLGQVERELRDRLASAQAAAPQEGRSAVDIQRVFRGSVVRGTVAFRAAAAGSLQRVFRGHCCRQAARARRRREEQERELAIFHYHAVAIQRSFRGFYSRRHYHDCAARKRYLEAVRTEGDALRERLQRQLEAQLEDESERLREQEAREFREASERLHHLVSTAATAGVFNSPFAPEVPAVDGVPLEEHLRASARDLVRRTGMRASAR